jgi:hypothetical protein
MPVHTHTNTHTRLDTTKLDNWLHVAVERMEASMQRESARVKNQLQGPSLSSLGREPVYREGMALCPGPGKALRFATGVR